MTKHDKSNLALVPSEQQPRLIKLTVTRRPIAPVSEPGPRTQAEVDAGATWDGMYANQLMGKVVEGRRVRRGWTRLILKLKGGK